MKYATDGRRLADRLGAGALRLALASLAQPVRVLVGAAILVGIPALGLSRLELRTDGAALVPPGDPAVAADRAIRARFGLRDPVVVLVESSDPRGIYNRRTLLRLRDLSRRLAAVDGVAPEDVSSLATERSFRYHREAPHYRSFFDPFPESAEDLVRLRSDVDAVGLFTGTLVSKDAAAAAVLVGVAPASDREAVGERRALTRRIAAVARAAQGPPDRVSVVGAPVAEALLGDHILQDLVVLLPLALVSMALVFWLGCRRFAGVLVGLSEIGACLAWTFGLMGWLGVPVYLTTAVLPVILTCVGLADEVHLLWRYQRLLAEEPGRPHLELLARTFRELARPVVFTSLTTAAGFLSFAVSPLPAVRSFGIFAACGVLFCLAWSLAVVPAIVAWLPAGALRRPPSRRRVRWWPAGPLPRGLRRRAAVLSVLGLVTLLLAAGVPRLSVQDSWESGFAPASAFRRASDRANRLLAGTHTLLVEVGFPSGTMPLLQPGAVRAIGDFEAFLAGRPRVGKVLGLRSHVTTTRYLAADRQEDLRRVPERPSFVRQMIALEGLVRGEDKRGELIDEGFRHTVITVLLEGANYRDTKVLLAAIRRYAAKHLAPLGASLRFGGDVAVSQAMIPAIVRGQLASLGLALAGMLVMAGLLYGSASVALVVVAPVSAAVLWIFGVMGWLDIPLGVATSMFCAVTLGIGVDYAIHLFDRYRSERAAGHPRPGEAAIRQAGPAILADAAAIALGFGILAFSRVPANRALGLLIAGALGVSCLLTLVGQGAWLTRSARRRNPSVTK